MARLFSTNFRYRNCTYTALVTICGTGQNTTVTIQVPDTSLHNYLPGGRLVLKQERKPVKEDDRNSPNQELVELILAAVQKRDGESYPIFDKSVS